MGGELAGRELAGQVGVAAPAVELREIPGEPAEGRRGKREVEAGGCLRGEVPRSGQEEAAFPSSRDMRRDYRDGRRCDPGDARRFADRSRPPPGALFHDLDGKARDAGVEETFRDQSRLQGPQLLEAFVFAPDVTLVTHPALEDRTFVPAERLRKSRAPVHSGRIRLSHYAAVVYKATAGFSNSIPSFARRALAGPSSDGVSTRARTAPRPRAAAPRFASHERSRPRRSGPAAGRGAGAWAEPCRLRATGGTRRAT